MSDHGIGPKYGRLTILGPSGRRPQKGKHHYVSCECDCGTVKDVAKFRLISGETESCGCLHRERVSTHGKSRSGTYRVWQNMIQRCENAKHKSYKDYGARGITVCDRWRHSFEAFHQDMGERPADRTIDRIKVNEPYCKENCRWADLETQGNNKRNNRLIEFQGRTQSVSQWAREIGVRQTTLHERINSGWPIGRALTEPKRARRFRDVE